MSRARLAYRNVPIDSSIFMTLGLTAAIINVLLLPPSESLSKNVSLDSLYGGVDHALEPFFDMSASMSMTRPKVVRDKLMALASANC